MRARTLRVVFETGEAIGVGSIMISTELVLHADGSVTGNGVLLAGDGEVAIAATGRHDEVLAPRAMRLVDGAT